MTSSPLKPAETAASSRSHTPAFRQRTSRVEIVAHVAMSLLTGIAEANSAYVTAERDAEIARLRAELADA